MQVKLHHAHVNSIRPPQVKPHNQIAFECQHYIRGETMSPPHHDVKNVLQTFHAPLFGLLISRFNICSFSHHALLC